MAYQKITTSENEKISTKYPYALTKRLGEELVLHFADVYKLNATSLRFLMFTVKDQELLVPMALYLEFS